MRVTTVEELISVYGITRVCHFAPFRNLHHILPGGAILSSERVQKEHPTEFNPTDELRLDKKRSHICTTIEYPNVWYLDKLEREADVYPNHAVFLLRPEVLTYPGALFCVRNAAGAGAGRLPGPDGFRALYERKVVGKMAFSRNSGHPKWLPTDMQAEVLIPNAIPLGLVTGLVVKSLDVAASLVGQLEAAKTACSIPLYISPQTFNPAFVAQIRNGGPRPREELYEG